ncbi:conserved hypothetical protein [Flavobacterium sp. 9AF]|uniref:DUF5908 family protein n=1 Tax=Flavobacterium sp. 9AF TaxID=2653142 RepID=UPI0012EFC8D5|nr:DUF5908 family protein [Flavobacterium sp. 9AF]VXB08373.1 conserved hypothetical protein [Flavobacterium sp. 9AF]
MPIEIRELIIKTEITSSNKIREDIPKENEINLLKKQLLDECRRMITEKTKKSNYKR